MTNRRHVVHIVASSLTAVAVFVLIALLAGPVAAQSGRRGPKPSLPAPAPTPEAAAVKEKPAETKDALSLIVGIERGAFSNVPNYLYDTVLSACAERLDDSPSVKADIANREMSRGEAVKRAKAETESHVVWIQLNSDDARSQSSGDLRDVYVEYIVFAPTTAKIVISGRAHQQAYGGGGVIAMPRPGGPSSLPYTEQLLKRAARDAAERILSGMHVSGRRVPA